MSKKAHVRRDYADTIKAADKADKDVVKQFVAYQSLSRISLIYELDWALKN